MMTETSTAAQLLVKTLESLMKRAPAIIAAAADQIQGIAVGLHFGDDSHLVLWAHRSRLLTRLGRSQEVDVEVYFDDRALRLLFALDRQPADELWERSLDVRGELAHVLAVWQSFRLLSQRAAGLRVVQSLWHDYQQQQSANPSSPPTPLRDSLPREPPSPIGTWNGSTNEWVSAHLSGWQGTDYLAQRHPEAIEQLRPLVGGTIHSPARTLWDGYQGQPWWQLPDILDGDLLETLEQCKVRARQTILEAIPDREPRAQLYDLMREYPSREGKGLRPTLTFVSCCALGGSAEDAIKVAAAIEIFHNAFLVHDDISDQSTHRRGKATLHEDYGIGIAVNTGDAMHLLAIDLMLSNLTTLGLARTLGLIQETMHMCRETVEGQAIELSWIRDFQVPAQDQDYFTMSTKKTGWYTCISPCRLGAICAGITDTHRLDCFNETFRLVGIAFQIQDDVLNLVGEEALYGKEPLGDLLEGKRTVMLIHLMRTANRAMRDRIDEIIRLPRSQKRQQDAEEILAAMEHYGSIDYAINLADQLAQQGTRCFEQDLAFVPESEAKAILRQIANYVITRPL